MKKILSLLFITSVLIAQVEIPILKHYANDFTQTLNSSELSSLNSTLKNFDDTTSNQVVFLMINTLDAYPLESYCYETATKNQIGSKKNKNGVLFFVARNDRKMRIEVGYGLEGALPDALTNSILRNEVRPYFKQSDYYAGINAGIDAIIKATRGEYKAETKISKDKNIPSFFFLIIFFILIMIFGRRGGGKGIGGGGGGGILPWLILSSMSGKRGGGGWGSGGSGSGFGGGGFGGFSGGGGSFGGGGSSGSW
jgi:uncharacterized protein